MPRPMLAVQARTVHPNTEKTGRAVTCAMRATAASPRTLSAAMPAYGSRFTTTNGTPASVESMKGLTSTMAVATGSMTSTSWSPELSYSCGLPNRRCARCATTTTASTMA